MLGWKGGGTRIKVRDNYFETNKKHGIDLERGNGEATVNFQSTYMEVYNNEIDGTASLYAGAGIIVKYISNSKIVNNLIKTGTVDGNHWGIMFFYGTGNSTAYGTGNTIKNNIIDNNVYFNTNTFNTANTFINNTFTGWNTYTPSGSWTVSGNTIGTWSPPTGIQAGKLFYYNQTLANATYNFTGNYKRTPDNTVFTNSITLGTETSAMLFKSSTQPPPLW